MSGVTVATAEKAVKRWQLDGRKSASPCGCTLWTAKVGQFFHTRLVRICEEHRP